MKTTLAALLRSAAFAAGLSACPFLAPASDDAGSDRAAQLLALQGAVPVKAATPYVEVGTFRIQVSTKLGRPAQVLEDGAWLYPNFTVTDSAATGTLVVRFKRNCVSELAIVTPATAVALAAGKRADGGARLASAPDNAAGK